MDYGLTLFAMAMVASFIGQKYIVGPIRERNKTHLLVLLLGGILGIAAVLLLIVGVQNIMNDVKNGNSLNFKSLCQQ